MGAVPHRPASITGRGLDERGRGRTKMTNRARVAVVAAALAVFGATAPATASSRSEIAGASTAALQRLYRTSAAARSLGAKAAGILVFPEIVKGGFLFAGQYGEGALLKGGKVSGYYNTVAASYGFQAGLQRFGYALFFMTPSSLAYLDSSSGWELGTGPSLTLVDEGFAKSFSTTTLRSDVYAFVFGQEGLMGGIGIQGTKITRIHPSR
jgi:lipid-binding SYLF domain-containing protein